MLIELYDVSIYAPFVSFVGFAVVSTVILGMIRENEKPKSSASSVIEEDF